MQLKENPEFSKEDILRVFFDIARVDIEFGKISQNIDEMYLSAEQKEILQARQEYGLTNIEDVKTLQQRLEKSISDGIFYSADQQDQKKLKRFETIKKAIPQYEEFKNVYLQLRQVGLEDELYKGIDFRNISYSELLERATTILKEKARVDGKRQEPIDEILDESIEQPSEQTVDNGTRINECGEIIRENNTGESIVQDSQVIEEISQTKASKQLEQTEKIQEVKTTELWKNRFQNWYSAIDRVSRNSRDKFLKMKADIVKAISNKIKERTNGKENDRQDEQEK